MQRKLTAFKRLLNIMDELRESCPWDKKQTFQSLRYLTIEETYELSDAIINNNVDEIKNELGDLMLHLIFYSKIASEKGAFDIENVLNHISDKLIHRHPHIYSDVKVNSEKEVKKNWEILKLKEGKKTVLGGVPISLPAMIKAQRIQEKAKGIGFDWEETQHVLDKVVEEINELKEALKGKKKEQIEEEYGDLLFSLINYARFIKINPEDALEQTNKKFITRFTYIEKKVKKQKKDLSNMSLAEMEELWNEAKSL